MQNNINSTIMYIDQLRHLIKVKRRSVNEVARLIGMSSTGFHASLNRDTLKVRDLYKIASVLHVNIKYFFTESEENDQDNHSNNARVEYMVEPGLVSKLENPHSEYKNKYKNEVELLNQKIKALENEVKMKDEALALKDTIIGLMKK